MERRNKIQRTDVSYHEAKFDGGTGQLLRPTPMDTYLNFYIMLPCGTRIRIYKSPPERNNGDIMSVEITGADKLIQSMDEQMRERRR